MVHYHHQMWCENQSWGCELIFSLRFLLISADRRTAGEADSLLFSDLRSDQQQLYNSGVFADSISGFISQSASSEVLSGDATKVWRVKKRLCLHSAAPTRLNRYGAIKDHKTVMFGSIKQPYLGPRGAELNPVKMSSSVTRRDVSLSSESVMRAEIYTAVCNHIRLLIWYGGLEKVHLHYGPVPLVMTLRLRSFL